MSYGRHRAVKYIAGCLIALGVLLIGLSTDDKSALVRYAGCVLRYSPKQTDYSKHA
jgi:hypothetical protein